MVCCIIALSEYNAFEENTFIYHAPICEISSAQSDFLRYLCSEPQARPSQFPNQSSTRPRYLPPWTALVKVIREIEGGTNYLPESRVRCKYLSPSSCVLMKRKGIHAETRLEASAIPNPDSSRNDLSSKYIWWVEKTSGELASRTNSVARRCLDASVREPNGVWNVFVASLYVVPG